MGLFSNDPPSKEEQAAAKKNMAERAKALRESGSKIHIENRTPDTKRSPVIQDFYQGKGSLQRGKK